MIDINQKNRKAESLGAVHTHTDTLKTVNNKGHPI
jgi:hypothetical protein